jgi:hypothetical protein
MSMSSDAVTKREKRLAAREDRKRRAAAAQRNARIRQIVLLTVLAVVLIGIVVAAVMTKGFGLMSGSLTPIGQAVATEGQDHINPGTAVTYKSRPPTSGPHYPTWSQTYGFMDPAPETGIWLHNLEHGAVAILYNCPEACPDLVQQLKDLYPTLPLGRNSRGGQPRALIFAYNDMDHKIAAVAWGWKLEMDELDKDQITRFYEQRIDRGPECVNFACP